MRRLSPLVLIVLLAIPVGQSASLSSELVSSSPIDLFGRIVYPQTGLRIFHQAHADGSLRATVYNGTLFEERHITVNGCPQPTSPRQERTIVLDVRSGDLANIFHVELRRHAMAVFEPSTSKDLVLHDGGAVDAANPSSDPPLYLVPNPYVHAQVENRSAPGGPAAGFAEAFSIHPFLIVPSSRADSTTPGLLDLESGEMRVRRGDQSWTYQPRTETRPYQCQPINVLTTGAETITRTYRLLIDSGTVTMEQSGLDRMQAYFDGQRQPARLQPNSGARSSPPPRGHWYVNDANLSRAYEDLSLPNTYFTADRLTVNVAGSVRFQDAFGTVSDNQTITEVDRKDVVLSGNLALTPLTAAEHGRRLTTRTQGELFVLDVQRPDQTNDLTPIVAGAAAGAIGLGLVTFLWPSLKWKATQLLLFPLYARLKKEDILENPLRDDILHVVRETPGISASELGRRLECGWGTLVYHITVLERMGLVSSAREGRHKRFFAQGRINYSDKGAVAMLANPAARTILDAVRHHPGIIQKELGELLNLAAGTISWHVERLTTQGLIVREEDGRVVRYYPSERLLELTKQLAA